MDETPVGRFVIRLASAAALAGGASLAFAIIVTVVSVVGRILIPIGLKPIPGDVELVQAAVMFAVFCFLPWCHLERGHAIVAIVTDRFPIRFSAVAEFLWDILMFVTAAFIAWRLSAGTLDKFGNRESTFILRIPLWIIYSAGMVGALVFVVAAAYCVVRSARNATSGSPVKPLSGAGE
jgi:TRAP-type C4-dicarboxylate transport system permease small subunit